MLARFRRRRMRRFVRELGVTGDTRILDAGGTPFNWSLIDVRPRVTFLNAPRSREDQAAAGEWVAGDGCHLPFRDKAFDIVFSNSVIEHVGTAERQRRFAGEIARVGRAYWVQTPNRRFPVEQHLLTPFVHWLPRSWQRAIVTRFTFWEWIEQPAPDRREYYVRHYLDEVRLLCAAEIKDLFPGARLIRERWCGLAKSLIAVRADLR